MVGFVGRNAKKGCSRCKKNFNTGGFGDRTDYSGYGIENWVCRDLKENYFRNTINVNQGVMKKN